MTSYKSVLHLSKIKARKNSRGRCLREFLYLFINITLREVPLHIK